VYGLVIFAIRTPYPNQIIPFAVVAGTEVGIFREVVAVSVVKVPVFGVVEPMGPGDAIFTLDALIAAVEEMFASLIPPL